MKSSVFSSSNRSFSHWRFNASLLIGLLAFSQMQGQEILFQETFETDGDGSRYTIEGGNPLIDFTAPSGNDKYFNDQGTNGENPTRLNLNFQDITYPIPAGTSTINLRIESTTTWWNEIVGIDNIRITSGELQTVEPTVSIAREGDNIVVSWTGILQSAADINGPWVDVADDTNSPIVIAPDDQLPMQFGRAVAP